MSPGIGDKRPQARQERPCVGDGYHFGATGGAEQGAPGHPAAEPALHGGTSDNGRAGGAERTAVAPLPGIVGTAGAGGPAQHDEAGNHGHGLTVAAHAIGPVHAEATVP